MLTNNNGIPATMLVGPTGYGYGNNGGGLLGGDLSILVLFFLFMMMGGWGGMGGFGFGMEGGLYPWLNNSQNINSGFRDQMMNDNVNSIREGVHGINNQLCNGFAGVTAAVTGAQNALTQQMYANQIADMERSFASQTANAQGFNSLTAQGADLKYTLASESCLTRQTGNDNTQKILDKLCQLELDGVRRQVADEQRENANLRSENQYLRNQADRTAQTALFERGLNNEVDALYNRLNNCPVPTTPVYGRTPIFTCNQNNGCGCGCGGF